MGITTEVDFQDPERLDLPSASAMEIVVNCPGSVRLKSSIPAAELSTGRSEQDDDWAQRGSAIHLAFENGDTSQLNPEMLEAYNTGIRYLEQIKEKWIYDKALDPSKVVECEREKRIFLHKPYAFPEMMGSAKLDRHFLY